jgi:2-polyprenyl-6-methoxyphenol hydroxylase-like FAD-dependent oxidoreductase
MEVLMGGTGVSASSRGDGHAVVIGASMAGLLAARVLSDAFERVTLIERDALPEEVAQRKGVPQGQHLHVLLVRGEQIVSRLFPGLLDDLVRDGATRFDFCQDMRWFQEGGYKTRFAGGILATAMSRPLLESHVRRRVLALDNVGCLDEREVTGLITNGGAERVTGVTLRRRKCDDAPEDTLAAELVVDAGGRGSRSPQWLEALGYGRPAESVVRIDLGYASRIYRLDKRLLPDARGVMTIPAPPSGLRGGAVAPLEGGRWIVTLCGWTGDYPAGDEAGFLEFARSLPAPDVYGVVSQAEPLGDIVTCRMPSNLRRRYERLKRFPDGYLIMGDALCSFNPVYGQGMTVSALEADLLERWLASGGGRAAAASRRFLEAAARIIDVPWTVAAGEDFRFPGVTGPKPPGTDLINRYMSRLHRTAIHDAEAVHAFFEVMNMLKPPTSLLSPRMALRVAGRRPVRAG